MTPWTPTEAVTWGELAGRRDAAGRRQFERELAAAALLLVEDDDQVRAVASRILAAAGDRILEAKGPHEALAIACRPGVEFDGLVTDIGMPRMGGRQLADLVTAIRPGIPVLFLSGYSDDTILQQGVRSSQFALVRKPLVAATRTAKVREVLDRRHEDAPKS